MSYVIALLAVLFFSAAFSVSGVGGALRLAKSRGHQAALAMFDRHIPEDEKERVARAAGAELLVCSVNIMARSFVSLLPSVAVAAAADFTGLSTWARTASSLSSPWLIGATFLAWISVQVARR